MDKDDRKWKPLNGVSQFAGMALSTDDVEKPYFWKAKESWIEWFVL